MWAAITNTIMGLGLMIAPAVFQFDKVASDNYYIVGPLVVTFAITALWEVNRPARYLNILPGIWLTASPFIFSFASPEAKWMAVISGLWIVGFSLVKGKSKGNYGGGWRSLFQKHPAHMR